MKFDSLARWPLLMGAVILFALAGVTLEDGSGVDALVAVACALIGSLLLGAWIVTLIVEAERKHHDRNKE